MKLFKTTLSWFLFLFGLLLIIYPIWLTRHPGRKKRKRNISGLQQQEQLKQVKKTSIRNPPLLWRRHGVWKKGSFHIFLLGWLQ